MSIFALRKRKRKCFAINREHLPFKILYLTFNSGQCTSILRAVYLLHLQMSPTQNGIIYAVVCVIGIMATPVLGMVSDKTKNPKLVLQVLVAFGCISSAAQIFVTPEPVELQCFTSACIESNRKLVNCSNAESIYNNSCTIFSNLDSLQQANMTKCSCISSGPRYGKAFWALMFLMPLLSISMTSGIGMLDSFILNKFTSKTRHLFGNQRMWASVGFAFGALLIGYLQDHFSLLNWGPNSAFFPYAFYPVILWVLCLVTFNFVDSSAAEESQSFKFSQIKVILSDIRMVFFIIYVITFGISLATGEIYMSWLAKERFDPPGIFYGISIFIYSLMDAPMSLISGFLISKMGCDLMMILGLAGMSTRLLLYTVATEAWHLIIADILRGLSWASTWIACCNQVAKFTPPELRASGLGLTSSCLFGIGFGVCALVGGILYDQFGANNLFYVSFGFTTFVLVIYCVFLTLHKRFKGEPKVKSHDEIEIRSLKDENYNDQIS